MTISAADLKHHQGPVRIAFKNGDRSWHECCFNVHSIHGDLVILNFIADGPGYAVNDKPNVVRLSEVTFQDASYYLTDWREAREVQRRRHLAAIEQRKVDDALERAARQAAPQTPCTAGAQS